MSRSDILVIGVGNDYRCDDAVGLVVARALLARVPASVEVIEASGDGSALMEAWRGRRAVILIDAVAADARPGTIYRFDLLADELPPALLSSTHAFGVAEAVELARSLEELPPHLLLCGIQGRVFRDGIGLSREVASALDAASEEVLGALRELSAAARKRPAGGTKPEILPFSVPRSHA